MTKRLFIVAIAAAMLLPVSISAQAPTADSSASGKKWTPPRTPWGEPDLQGTFSNRTITPFERPANVNGPRVLHAGGSRGAREARAGAERRRGSHEGHPRRRRARLQRLLVGSRHQGDDAADVAGDRSAGRPRAGADRGREEARGRRRRSGRRFAAPARTGAAPTPGSIAARSSAASRAACPAR